MQEKDMVYFYHKILDKLMYLNSLFYKSCSVCVCRSSILFIFMLNLVNLLGVFLDCLSTSHRLVFILISTNVGKFNLQNQLGLSGL